jgi:hypothetical protein
MLAAVYGTPAWIALASLRTATKPYTGRYEVVRAGVGLPALMKLLGHINPEMTMRCVDVAGSNLQREFHLARSQPRHLAPQPKAPNLSPHGGLDGVVGSLLFAQHARNVPSFTSKRRCEASSRPTRQSADQNPHRNPQAQARRITGRDWPYKPTIRQSGSRTQRRFSLLIFNASLRVTLKE